MAVGRIPSPINSAGGVDPIVAQLMQSGNTMNGRNQQGNTNNNLLMQMALAKNMKPLTLLGMILGNVLGQGATSWKDNYDARGYLNDSLLNLTSEEREKELEKLRRTNPSVARAAENYLQQPRFQKKLQQSSETQGGADLPISPMIQQQGMQAAGGTVQGLLGDGGQLAQAANQYNFPTAEELMRMEREKELRQQLGLGGF